MADLTTQAHSRDRSRREVITVREVVQRKIAQEPERSGTAIESQRTLATVGIPTRGVEWGQQTRDPVGQRPASLVH